VFTLRRSTLDDRESVLRVLEARDLADFGADDYTRLELIDQWRAQDFDPRAHAAVAEAAGRTIGYAAVLPPGTLAFVDPSWEGRGVGSALLRWTEGRCRTFGQRTFRQRVASSNPRARALLLDAGYHHARSILRMTTDPSALNPQPAVGAGLVLSELDPRRDLAALHEADARAFAANADYQPGTLPSFYDEHVAAPNLDPGLSRLAWRGAAVVGFVLCRRLTSYEGYVDLLAVDPAERRQGLGTTLLATAFEAFARAGLRRAWLEVASDNPAALRLYERAGMTASDASDVYEKPRRDGTPAPSDERRLLDVPVSR
jgi:mycothiol synthase